MTLGLPWKVVLSVQRKSCPTGLQLKITTSTKFPWEVGVAVDKHKYKYEKKRGEGTNTVKNSGMQFSQHAMQL